MVDRPIVAAPVAPRIVGHRAPRATGPGGTNGTSTSTAGSASVVTRAPGAQEATPRRYKVRRRRIEIAVGTAVPILLLSLWQLLSETHVLDPRFFPPTTAIWSTGVHLYANGEVPRLLGDTFLRVVQGFALGVAVGLVLGILLGTFRFIRVSLQPITYALWTVPKLTTLPLFLFFFGITSTLPVILLIAIECAFLVLIGTMAAVHQVPETYREAAASFGANRWQTLRYVTFPGALPQIFTSFRIAAGASVLVGVVAEFFDGRTGIGYFILNSYQLFAINQMYVGIVTVSIFGAAWTLLIGGLGRLVVRWQDLS